MKPLWACLFGAMLLLGCGEPPSGKSITDTRFEWPSRDAVWRTLTLADYNTRVVLAGVTALGAAGGLVGTFLLLRKRSLLSDTVSHSTLPGIALAFMIAEATGHTERSLPILLLGAVATGLLGMAMVVAIRSSGRVKDDAALAIVLSVFFGLGIALLVIVQQLPTGNAAGLSRYIYGKTAAMTADDARLILIASLGATAICAAFFKELKLLCFDASFARTQGWPVLALDFLLMGLVVAVTVIGLQAVGLLLIVALLIVPAAAARFWSHHLGVTLILATAIGALSGLAGAAASALFPKLPAGAVIVLASVACFAVSLAFGRRRGLVIRWWQRHGTAARVGRQHLMRGIYEWCESHGAWGGKDAAALLERDIPVEELRISNHWSHTRARKLLRAAVQDGLLNWGDDRGSCHLSPQGKIEARRVTRNHRLWETYLLRYADVAPQHIHHNADQIEHVIEPHVVNELEELLAERGDGTFVPADPESVVRHEPTPHR